MVRTINQWFGKPKRGTKSTRRGASTVEFAIVAPLFFMLIFGCIEFGRGLMVQQILTNASRVGAREAITLNSTEANVISKTTNFASNASISGITVGVSPNPAAAQSGDLITVDVSVPFSNVSWIPAPWFMGGSTTAGLNSNDEGGI